METAKVDMRRLQLLNDRIAQVMEALNQVRFSVHGLQHSTQAYAPWATQQYGIGYTNPIGVQQGLGFTPGVQQGLGFNPGVQQNLGFNPGMQQNLGFNPGMQQNMGFTPGINVPFHHHQNWVNPMVGLSHSPYEAIDANAALRFGIDPFTTARVAQTFPFAYSAVAPISAIG